MVTGLLLGFGIGLILTSGLYIIFQWPAYLRAVERAADRDDLIKELAQARDLTRAQRNDIADRDQRLADLDQVFSLANEEIERMEGVVHGLKDTLAAIEEGAQAAGGGAQAAQIVELAQAGYSRSRIEEEVFGYSGGKAYRAVKSILSPPTTQ